MRNGKRSLVSALVVAGMAVTMSSCRIATFPAGNHDATTPHAAGQVTVTLPADRAASLLVTVYDCDRFSGQLVQFEDPGRGLVLGQPIAAHPCANGSPDSVVTTLHPVPEERPVPAAVIYQAGSTVSLTIVGPAGPYSNFIYPGRDVVFDITAVSCPSYTGFLRGTPSPFGCTPITGLTPTAS